MEKDVEGEGEEEGEEKGGEGESMTLVVVDGIQERITSMSGATERDELVIRADEQTNERRDE